eukprot:jgi/Botrbrau1/9557/Bobra.0089s0016.1
MPAGVHVWQFAVRSVEIEFDSLAACLSQPVDWFGGTAVHAPKGADVVHGPYYLFPGGGVIPSCQTCPDPEVAVSPGVQRIVRWLSPWGGSSPDSQARLQPRQGVLGRRCQYCCWTREGW